MFYRTPNKPGFGHGKPKGRRGEQNFPGADYTADELEWLKAVEGRRRAVKGIYLINDAHEILKLAYHLGYRKTSVNA